MHEVEWVEDRTRFLELINSERFTVVDFSAPAWCVPCQRLAPHYEKAAEATSFRSDMLGLTNWVAVDVDKAPWSSVEYGVRGVPTVAVFYKGKRLGDVSARTAPKLLDEIRDLIS